MLMYYLHSQRTLPVSRLVVSCSQDLYAGMTQVQIAQRSKNGVFMTWSCSCVCLRTSCWDHGNALYWQLRPVSFSLWSSVWNQSHVIHMTRKTRAFLRGKLLGMHVQYKRKMHFQVPFVGLAQCSILCLYHFFLVFCGCTECGLWDFSSLTRDWTQALGSESTKS